nr:helix-turn-helix domain-containing protein [Chania multitudinisentens]
MLVETISLDNSIITDTQVIKVGDAFLFSPRRARIRLSPLTTSSEIKFISTRLRCGTGFPLFNLSLEELRDKPVSLHEMALKYPFPALAEIPFKLQVSQLELWLSRMLDQHLTTVSQLAQAANHLYYGEALSIVRERLALSPRTMERHIRHFIGVDARYFCRTARFQHTLRHILAGGDILDSALAYGYTDQSHFIKTCRFYTGLTPSQLFTEQYKGLHYYISPKSSARLKP